MDVGAEQRGDRCERDDRLDALEEFSFRDLLDEIRDEPVAEAVGDEVRHQKRAALGLFHAGGFAGERGFEFGLVQRVGELLPDRAVAGFCDLKNFSREDALGEKSEFVDERKLGRVAALHEPRGDFFQQCGSRVAGFQRQARLRVFEGGAVGAVRHCDGSSRPSGGFTTAFADVLQKVLSRRAGCGFSERPRRMRAAVVVGTAGENLAPGFGMRRL